MANKYYQAVKAAIDIMRSGKADIVLNDQSEITFDARGIVKTITLPDGRKVYAEFSKKGISMGNVGGGDPIAIWRISPTKLVDAGKAMAANYGIVYACVSAVADEISQMQFKLFQVGKDGSPEELNDHELLDLLDSVNERQTGPEFKWTMAAHLELTGNAYVLLLGVNSETDKPKGMFLLTPSAVRPMFDKTTFPWVIKQYEFTIENKIYRYEPYEIVHLKYPDASDPYIGMGKVQAAGYYIDGDNDVMQFNRNYFLSGSKLGAVLQSEATDEAALERLRISWENLHQGAGNAHRPFIMPKGVKLADNQPKAQDMDFGNFWDKTMARIMLVFRVSRTILGTAESDTNRATAETADYVFAKRTIKPKMLQICSYINEFLVPRYGPDIYIGFNDPTPEDKNFKVLEQKTATGGQPVMSQNEAREKYYGLGPVDGGDQLLVQNNMLPVGMADGNDPAQAHDDISGAPQNSGGEGKGGKKPAKKGGPRMPLPRFFKNMQVRRRMAKDFADIVSDKLNKIKAKKITELSAEEYFAVWQKFVQRTTEWQKKLHSGLVKTNNDQEQEVQKNFKSWYEANKSQLPAVTKALKPSDLLNVKKWISIVVDMATPILTDQAKTEGESAGADFGEPGLNILEDAGVKESLDRATELFADHYTQTTADQVYGKITESLDAGDSLDQISDKIQGVYGYASSVRADMVAKTETFRVGNYATKVGWQQTGVKTIKWYTAEDGEVCAYCQTMQGKVIDINENFFDQGDSLTVDGQTMSLDYSDVEAPPLHVNCRCYQRPEDVGDAGLD